MSKRATESTSSYCAVGRGSKKRKDMNPRRKAVDQDEAEQKVAEHHSSEGNVQKSNSFVTSQAASVRSRSAADNQQQKRLREESEEGNNPKRSKISSEAAGEPGGTESSGSESRIIKNLNPYSEYGGSGVKLNLHGTVYQLKLLMLFLKRALDREYSFYLATEMDAAEKFDDIVFAFMENNKEVIRLVQVKDTQGSNKKITLNDFLAGPKDDFSLEKYFISYCEMKQKPEFRGGIKEIRDLVISANIDIHGDLKDYFEIVNGEDNILNYKKSNHLKFKIDEYRMREHTKKNVLKNASTLNRLAEKLASCVLENKVLDSKGQHFRSYHVVLGEKVIDVKNIESKKGNNCAKFLGSFLDGKELEEEVNIFRNAFLKAYLKKNPLDENDFWQEMEKVELKLSKNFGKIFKLANNPELTNPKELGKVIANAISKAKRGNVNISRRGGHEGDIINQDIDKLAGYVLIKKDDNKKEDTYCFRSAFFDGLKKLPGNLESFKIELIAELENKIIKLNKDNRYAFHIADFTTCEEEQLDVKLSLPDDKSIEEDINSFFEKLVFSVSQPSETELDKIIETEMGELSCINLIDSKPITDLFLKEMLDWLNMKIGYLITHEDGKLFFKEFEEIISKFKLIGTTEEYCKKIENFGIAFATQPSGLQDFLDFKEKQIFNIITLDKSTMLSSINVLQTLKDKPYYQKLDSMIFISLEFILHSPDLTIETFKSKKSMNLLVIECNPQKRSVDDLCIQLIEVIESNPKKKVIIITQEEEELADRLKSHFLKYKKYMERQDKNNSLYHLTPDSQQIVLEKEIVFQGKNVKLAELIDKVSKHLVKGEVLSMLIRNDEKINIGGELSDLNYERLKNYYIHRAVERHINIEIGFSENSKFQTIIDNDRDIKSDIPPPLDKDIVIISSEENDFIESCGRYSNNIHWLMRDENELVWKQSRGKLSELRKFVDLSKQIVQSNVTDINDKVVIVAAEPGMGKSTELRHLALEKKKSTPSLWIVRINLLDYSTKFKKLKDINIIFNKEEALKFLYRAACFHAFQQKAENVQGEERKEEEIEEILGLIRVNDSQIDFEDNGGEIEGLDKLEIELFNKFLNQGKVSLLFDGLDEISPHYKQNVFELLKILKNLDLNLWITTHSYNIQNELENRLSVLSYSLKPFDEEQQRSFLKKFWKTNLGASELNEERSILFTDEILTRFSEITDERERDFISIPLLARMIADIFQEMFKDFCASEQELSNENEQEINDLMNKDTLYTKFIDKIFHNNFEKQSVENSKPYLKIMAENEFKKFIEEHRKLAAYAVFENYELRKLFSEQEISEVKVIINNTCNTEEKIGIIERISDDKPKFVHQTFAEYFVSDLIYDKLNNTDHSGKSSEEIWEFLLNVIFIQDNCRVIRNFLNCKLDDDKLTKSMIDRKNQILSEKVRKLLAKVTNNNKNQLHVASKEGLTNIVKLLLANHSDVNVTTKYKKMTALLYSARNGHLDIVKELLRNKADVKARDTYGKTALSLASCNGNGEIVKVLLDSGSDVHARDEDGNTVLHLAALHGNENTVKVLLDSGSRVNAQDKYGNTALHLAVKSGHKNIVKVLLDNGSNVIAQDESGKTVLHLAVKHGHENIVKILLDSRGSDVNTQDKDGDTALHIAAVMSYRNVAEALLNSGADVNTKNLKGKTVLHLAVENDHENIVKLLLDSGSNVNAQDKDGDTALHIAAVKSYRKVAEVLLVSGADVNTKNLKGKTVLHLVTELNEKSKLNSNELYRLETYEHGRAFLSSLENCVLDFIYTFIDKGADVNAQDLEGNTALHFAAKHNLPLVVETLMRSGAAVNVQNHKGWTALHFAARNKHFHVVDKLLNNGADVNAQNCDYSTALHFAVRNAAFSIINALLDKGADVNAKDRDGDTALHLAAKNCYQKVVKVLLSNGADVNAQNYRSVTALHFAAENGHLCVVKALLLKEAYVNAKGSDGKTALQLAAVNGHLGVVKALLCNEDNVNSKNSEGKLARHLELVNGRLEVIAPLLPKIGDVNAQDYRRSGTALHFAAENGHLGVVMALLCKEADVNAKDSDGKTALQLAAIKGHLTVVNTLLANQADANAQDYQWGTALHYSAENGHLDVVKTLCNEANVNNTDFSGRTALHCAAQNGHLGVVEALLCKNADVSVQRNKRRTALHYSAENGHLNVVGVLLYYNADVNAQDYQRKTALHFAAKNGHLDVVEALLCKNADVNCTHVFCKSALHYAAQNGHLGIVEALLYYKADVNAQDYQSRTALHFAAENGNLDVVRALLYYNADVNTQDYQRKTALHFAAENGHLDVVEALLYYNANVNAQHGEGRTALHFAAENGHLDVVKTLLYNQGDVNAQDYQRRTALHFAANNGHQNVVGALLYYNADDNAQDYKKQTALHFAAKNGHLFVVGALLYYNADVNAQDYQRRTALHFAAENGHLDVIGVLLYYKADVNDRDYHSRTGLHLAAKNGHLGVVKTLLGKEAYIDAHDYQRRTALHFAAENGHMDVIRALLCKNADVNFENYGSSAELYSEAENGDLDVVDNTALHVLVVQFEKYFEPFLESGANVNYTNLSYLENCYFSHQESLDSYSFANLLSYLKTSFEICERKSCTLEGSNHKSDEIFNVRDDRFISEGDTAFHDMVFDFLNAIENFLACGADIDDSTSKCLDRICALSLAIKFGMLKLIQSLLGHVNVNAEDKAGKTALHHSMEDGTWSVVQILLEKGARVNLKDKADCQPLHYAAGNGFLDIVQLLLNKGADTNIENNNGKTPLDLARDSLAQGNEKCRNVVDILSSITETRVTHRQDEQSSL